MHQAAPIKMLKIVTVKRDTAAGVRLGFMSLQFLDIPKELATADMITSLSDVDNHITKAFIPAGEPLRKNMFFRGERGLSQSLEPDERAITLKLDDDYLVDHQIVPDDLVDVLVVSSKDNEKYTKTICQAARVVMCTSKEQTLARHLGGNANKITLAVNPILAESISEAAEVGKIRLALRNPLSVRKEALDGAEEKSILPSSAFQKEKEASAQAIQSQNRERQMTLLTLPPPPAFASVPVTETAPAAAAAPVTPLDWMVQVFSGNKKETVSVPRG
jgi:Flp pilus assembly protein CpaB